MNTLTTSNAQSVRCLEVAEIGRAFVYGLGVSGKAAVQLLARRGVSVIAHDRRSEAELDLAAMRASLGSDESARIEWWLGRAFGEAGGPLEAGVLPEGVDAVVLSPGVPSSLPELLEARSRGIEIVAEVELAWRALPAAERGSVLAVTGSNGKSTTTEMTGSMLRKAGFDTCVCGNIGEPMSACVDGPPGRVFVVELSSFQLETTRCLRPRAAALLNLSADHLDRYEDFDGYQRAKERIFLAQRPSDVAILNADDPVLSRRGLLDEDSVKARRRHFSATREVADGCYLAGDRVVEVADGCTSTLFAASDVPLPGAHNLENAMAAALLARAVDAEASRLRAALLDFVGLPHRTQKVRQLDGVSYYDDSKGTNMAATERSLEGFDDASVHLILGGRNKDADPSELRSTVQRKAVAVYLIGEAAEEFAIALDGAVRIEHCKTLERAVALAHEHARSGEVVLLSPACASFDQFKSYIHRGSVFQQLVGRLESAGGASHG